VVNDVALRPPEAIPGTGGGLWEVLSGRRTHPLKITTERSCASTSRYGALISRDTTVDVAEKREAMGVLKAAKADVERRRV
jgi:hypothetical protein